MHFVLLLAATVSVWLFAICATAWLRDCWTFSATAWPRKRWTPMALSRCESISEEDRRFNLWKMARGPPTSPAVRDILEEARAVFRKTERFLSEIEAQDAARRADLSMVQAKLLRLASSYTERVDPPPRPPFSSSSSSIIRDRRVPGTINGVRVSALPDTGADASFISPSFLARLQRKTKEIIQILPFNDDTNTPPPSVRLASGKSLTPVAAVSIPWRFDNETRPYELKCLVLPRCAHDLILGAGFLRATETLTRFKGRIATTLRALGKKGFWRVNYLGGWEAASAETSRVWGRLAGEAVAALPDSGSDLMVVSGEYARRRGFRIERGGEGRMMVEVADGSTAWTEGLVRGLEWEFRDGDGGKVASDFYVLEGLPVDVIFSGDFVFDHNVFGAPDGWSSLRDHHGLLDVLQLCNIRLIGRFRKAADQLLEEGLGDVTSPDAFNPLRVQRELARRDAAQDAISQLPITQQPAAEQAELERQSRWEQWRILHAQRWASTSALTPSTPAATNSQGSNATSAGGTRGFLRASRWVRRKKAASIPLMPL